MTRDRVPWLIPGVSLASISISDSAVIRSAGSRVSLVRSPPLARLVAELGGTIRGPAPMVIPGRLQPSMAAVIDDLIVRGIAILASRDTSPVHLAIADRCGVEPSGMAAAAELLAGTPVEVIQLDPALPGIAELVASTGIMVSEDVAGNRADLVVVVSADLLEDAALGCLWQLWQTGRRFLAASVRGCYLSPLFSPGLSVCPACVSATIRANHPGHALLEELTGTRPASAMTPAGWDHLLVVASIANLVAGYLLDAGQRERNATCATVLAADGAPRQIPMFSRPGCPECDTSAQSAADSVDERFGLIRSIEISTAGEDLWIARAEHALMTADFNGSSAAAADHAYRARSEGKGLTARAAAEGAAAEAVERICGVFHPEVPVSWGRAADLAAPALMPSELAHYSPRQYECRRVDNQVHSACNHVPPPFDPSARVPWTPAVPLGGGDQVLVPCAYAFTDADQLLGVPKPLRSIAASSNGCASGRTLEDAWMQALLELIERDAVAIWWYNRLQMPGAGRDVMRRPVVGRVRRILRARQRQLHVLDLTHDLSVPVCAAVSSLRSPGSTGSSEIIVGFGAALTAGAAADRACLEALQFLPMLDALPTGPQRFSRHAPDSRQWWGTARAQDQSWLAPDDGVVPASSRELHGLDDLVAALGACGLSVLWIDQTQRRFAVPVVRVIVPGLRHFWRQLGPGRLYEVPVACGRQPVPLAEEDLNPFSVFF